MARAALHFWEEPPLSGTRGAGTVFFSGCSLGCVFCQNQAISQADFGKTISVDRLRAIFQELVAQGAHNIDLVNPTHFAHVVAQALEAPLPIPVVWNDPGGMTGWRPSRPWKGRSTSISPTTSTPTPRGAKAYAGGGGLPGGGPGGHPGDGPPDRDPTSWTGTVCSGGGCDPPPPPPRTAGPGQGGYWTGWRGPSPRGRFSSPS